MLRTDTFRESRGAWFIIGTGVLLFVFFWLGLGFNGLYGQDSHTYYAFAKSLRAFFSQGESLPPFYWPYGYSFSGYVISLTGIPLLFALRLVAISAMIGSLLRARKLIRELSGRESWWWLVLAGLLQLYFLRSGIVVMSDALATWCSISAVLCVVRFHRSAHPGHFLLALVYMVLACFVRMAAIPLLVVPLVFLMFDLWKLLQVSGKILLILALLSAVITGLGFRDTLFQGHLNEFSERWRWVHFVALNVTDADGYSQRTVPNILYVLGNFAHPGYLSFGVLLLPFYRKPEGWGSRMLILTLIAYLIFLAGLGTQNYRFLVMSHPLVLVLLFPAFMRFWAWLKNKRLHWVFVVGTAAVNGTFAWYSFGKTYRWYQLERTIAATVKQELKSDKTPIYSFYVDQSFPSYGIDNEVRNFFQDDYTDFEEGALVVFSPDQFAGQWKDHRVMNNWKRLVNSRELDTLYTFESNWTVYRIR